VYTLIGVIKTQLMTITPHTQKEQEDFILIHKIALRKLKYSYPTRENMDEVHKAHEKLMQFIDVEMYNKYAVNICKFSNSIDTEECCEGVFRQTLRHYSVHGNCCQSCSNYFSFNARSN